MIATVRGVAVAFALARLRGGPARVAEAGAMIATMRGVAFALMIVVVRRRRAR